MSWLAPLARTLVAASLAAPVAQGTSTLVAHGLPKLLTAALALLTAVILAAAALTAAVVALVLWWVPQAANPAAVSLVVAATLGLLAVATWLSATGGRALGALVEEALRPPPGPVEKANATLQHLARALQRGWEGGAAPPPRR